MNLPSEVVAAYLDRLGLAELSGAPPSIAGLRLLQQRHVERIPWETLWIHEGLAWPIDPVVSASRIASSGRGGYCFHLNGAFGALLAVLGYSVSRHVGGVHGPEGPSVDMLANHLALIVLVDGERWYVDVGLGDALHSPAPLVAGEIEQPPFAMTLSAVSSDGVGDWHLAHDPRGAFGGMSFCAPSVGMDAFAERHEWLSTSPESGFVRFLVAQRRTATEAIGLRGLVHTVVSPDDVATTIVEERTAWFALLADVFGLAPEGDLDPLWERVLRAHEEWTSR